MTVLTFLYLAVGRRKRVDEGKAGFSPPMLRPFLRRVLALGNAGAGDGVLYPFRPFLLYASSAEV